MCLIEADEPGGHDCDSSPIILHELYLIEFRETSLEGVDVRNTATRVNIPITYVINFGVNSREHSISHWASRHRELVYPEVS